MAEKNGRIKHVTAALLVALCLRGTAAADVFVLKDGDRITGRVISKTARTFRVETAHGRLNIPRAKVARWQRADGKEEVLVEAGKGSPSPAPVATPSRRLVLVVLGNAFFYAWDRREAPPDPSLRLEVRLDEEVVATFTDPTLDPGEMPGAAVNAFSFDPAQVKLSPAEGVASETPEVRPGRIVLKLALPAGGAGTRRARVAYQANGGTADAPAWRDLATASLAVTLGGEAPTFLQMRQERGQMEFSGFPRRRMKKVETFAIDLAAE